MTPRLAPLALAVALTGLAATARADSNDATAAADSLFRSGKSLRAAGSYPEACDAFAKSKQLAAGIGVSLYLADCYEHVGKKAMAWAEFRDAEKRAREHKDKRADVARARAAALEPGLGHLGIASPLGQAASAKIRIDEREPQPLEPWSAAVVDPGDHDVTVLVGGEVARKTVAHVDAGRWAVVRLDAPPTPTPGFASPSAPVSADGDEVRMERPDTRRVVGYALLAASLVGVAAGTGLLALKNDSMTTGAPGGSPTVDSGAAIGSDVAFAVGGAAFVSAVILYLTAPARKDSALVVAPLPLIGGAGAVLGARF